MDCREFTMSPTSAEPKGYMAGVQTPDRVIHLISSRNHYAFNPAWLKTPPPTEPVTAPGAQQQGGFTAGKSGFQQTDVFFAGELGYKEFRIPALVVTKSGTLLAISEAGQTAQQLSPPQAEAILPHALYRSGAGHANVTVNPSPPQAG